MTRTKECCLLHPCANGLNALTTACVEDMAVHETGKGLFFGFALSEAQPQSSPSFTDIASGDHSERSTDTDPCCRASPVASSQNALQSPDLLVGEACPCSCQCAGRRPSKKHSRAHKVSSAVPSTPRRWKPLGSRPRRIVIPVLDCCLDWQGPVHQSSSFYHVQFLRRDLGRSNRSRGQRPA